MIARLALIDLVLATLMTTALLSPLLAPFDPFDPAAHRLGDARLAPMSQSLAGEAKRYWFGTDSQGRDILSTLLFGLRQSLWIGGVAVILSMIAGTGLGLIAGYHGGLVDAVIMRVSDMHLAVPSILLAMMLFVVARSFAEPAARAELAPWLIIAAIALSDWVLYARTVRAVVQVERQKEYVVSAIAIGASTSRILLRHILPNVTGPVIAVAALSLPMAIIAEATLSFLGVGLPPGQPSLGTMIARGQSEVYSGAWWTLTFPAGALIVLSLSVNAVSARWQRRWGI